MGLFDKLREMAEDALGSANAPKKKYYDFTLNVLSTAKLLRKEDIKKCYKAKMGEECDDAVLTAVLTKFTSSTEPKTKEIWYERTVKQECDEKIPAAMLHFKNADEVYALCFSDFSESIRLRFAEVLDTIRNCADSYHLDQACEAMMRYPSFPYPHSKLAAKVMAQEMINRFYEKDPTVTAIVRKDALSHLTMKDKKQDVVNRAYAVTLRALHYENFIEGTAGYTSITEEDCKEAVENSAYYKKEIAKEPYYKDSVISNATRSIFKEKPFMSVGDFVWSYWALRDVRFADAVCNDIWKDIADQYEDGDTTEIEEVVNILYDYIVTSDED